MKKKLLFIIISLVLLITVFFHVYSGEAADKLLIEYKDDLLTLKVEDILLEEVLDEIEQKTGVKVTSHDLTEQKITVEFHALPLDEGIRKVIGNQNNSIFLYEEKKGADDSSLFSKLTEVRIFPKEEGMNVNPETVKAAPPPPAPDNTSEPDGTPEEPQFNVLYRNILESKEPEIREAAVEKLTEMEGPEVLDTLIMALGDEDGDVRASAAEALGTRKNKEAFEPLIKALSDKDPWVRESAADALGSLGDPRAIKPLKMLLEDEDEDVRESVSTSLELLEAME